MKYKYLVASIATALIASFGVPAAAQTAGKITMPVATAAEQAVLAKFANAYLSSLPDNDWYDVTAEEVFKRIKSGNQDFVIVDVRVPKEKKYDVGHLPGAMFIGAPDVAKPESLAKLPRDKDIIVHCDTGQQQNKVVTALRMMGYKAHAMKWGYMAWHPAPPTGLTLDEIKKSITVGYPVEK
jgi:rhodanese-related sulfurtransferase